MQALPQGLQHVVSEVRGGGSADGARRMHEKEEAEEVQRLHHFFAPSACVSIRQHTLAYVSIRQHTSAEEVECLHDGFARAHRQLNVSSMRQHTSAYVSMRQHASAYVSGGG